MNTKTKFFTLATAVAGVIAGATAQAANPGFAFGDLILAFQATGSPANTNFVLVNAGQAGTLRSTPGNLSLINAGVALSAQFGASWFDRTDLYVGAATVWDVDAFNDAALLNGDPTYTSYISAPRNAVGVAGSPQSVAYSLTDPSTTGAADAIYGVENDFENRGTGAISTLSNAGSFIDWVDQNPVGGTAFGVFPSGVQAQFGLGNFGTLGGVTAEAALDLYRIQWLNNVPGQYGFGAPTFQGGYEGSIVIASTGQISLINTNVPEPTSLTLLGLGAGFVGLIRRRRPVAA